MSNDGGALIVIGSRDLRAFYCYFFSLGILQVIWVTWQLTLK